ncbi:MAG TPA: flagellar protein FlaG [Gallionellaceae bacterium]|nr:flagellar protein FlaG [Gallionellaceae bacterium]
MLIQNTNSSAPLPTGFAASGGPAVPAAQTPQGEVAQAVAQQPSPAQVSHEVGRINEALQRANKNLELSISVDATTKKQVVKLTDKDTGDTLLQYPSDAVLAIARGIDQFQHGLLLKQEA